MYEPALQKLYVILYWLGTSSFLVWKVMPCHEGHVILVTLSMAVTR